MSGCNNQSTVITPTPDTGMDTDMGMDTGMDTDTPSIPATQFPVVGDDETLFLGAGDIAQCNPEIAPEMSGQEKTAQLIETYPPDTPVFTLGDNVYPDGTLEEYENCYDLSWGRFKDRTYPVTGNHEYRTTDLAGYFSYFGERAGDKTYYSFNLKNWHVIVLDSECPGGLLDGVCLEDDPQMRWMRDDLDASSNACTLALWHRPRISTGQHGVGIQLKFFYDLLVDKGVDLAVTGHDHHYERFAPLNKSLEIDQENGIRQFVVGTGGSSLRDNNRDQAESEFESTEHHGIIELHLKVDSYAWRFIAVDGQVIDSGEGFCH